MADESSGSAYPHHWEADVVLRDGATAHLRPIRPDDADALQAFHGGQSDSSIYLRFFSFKAKLSTKELRRFTEVDYVDRVALIVTVAGGIIGVGRYDRLEDPAEAEVAFNISDEHQGRGLGSILLEHLAAAARENGIRRFVAEVLPENRKMLSVFTEAGYEVRRYFDDGVVSTAFEIDPTQKSREVMESREHRAEARSVRALLEPGSIALIGASRRWGTIGHRLLDHLVEGGFEGRVHAVNPDALEVAGMPSLGRISEVPEPVDLAVVAVPYEQVLGVVIECAQAGAKAVVIVSDGFAEDGARGLARQRELVRTARAYGMRVLGPGSLGLVNTAGDVRLNLSMAPQMPRSGGLALFSQSASIGVALYAAAHRRRLGFSSIVSAGNRADVSGNDAMQYWEDDDDTEVVGLYLESFGNPRKFSRIARRLARNKPVIVAKSEVLGLRLPPGHAVRTTEAPPGALDAMLRQAGVIRVATMEELTDVAQIAAGPLPTGSGTAVLSNSLALGRVVADVVQTQGRGLELRETVTDLNLGQGRSLALPLIREAVSGLLAREDVASLVVALMPAPGLTVEAISAEIASTAAESGKTVVVSFTGILDPRVESEGLLPAPEDTASPLAPQVPCFGSAPAAITALAAITRYALWRRRDDGGEPFTAEHDAEGASALIAAALRDVSGEELRRLNPGEAAGILRCYGIEVLPSLEASDAEAAVRAAEALGWPVVLKSLAPNLRYRLDLGGVRLDIGDADSLRRAFGQMSSALASYGGDGIEVQSMAPVGQACVLRAIEDPLLGPVLSFGIAGDAVTLLDDWAHRVPPLSRGDVRGLVRSPRAAKRLFGYEGLPGLDVSALEELLGRVSLLKEAHPEVSLLELRPVVGESGLTVLSAELWLGNAAQRTDSARRALSN